MGYLALFSVACGCAVGAIATDQSLAEDILADGVPQFNSTEPVELSAGCSNCCQTGTCYAAYKGQYSGRCCRGYSNYCCPNSWNGKPVHCGANNNCQYGQAPAPYPPAPPPYNPPAPSPPAPSPYRSSCLGRCGIALNIGKVGSCAIFSCSKSRGPTHCKMGMCFCNDGYCRYPVTTMHIQSRKCLQRAGTDTCHATRFCYNAGFTQTTCSGGLCFCKMGYKYNCNTKKCDRNSMTEEQLGSSMTEEELAEQKAQQEESDRETMYQALAAGVWMSALMSAMIGGVAVWRSRARKVATPAMLLG